MSFKTNPLSLSVPEHAFESWLRDSGYLDLVDSSAPSSSSSSSSSAAAAAARRRTTASSTPSASSSDDGFLSSLLSFARTLASLLTLNPFARLTAADLAAPTPSWPLGFVGAAGAASYSWPPSPAQARLRVQENVRRYARNYAALSILVLACCLYRMPIALVGLVASLAAWEGVRFGCHRWELEQRLPGLKQSLVRIAQIATAILLYVCNVQFALVYAIGVSYAVMILHASLRKLTPSTQSNAASRHKRLQPKRF